MLPHVRYLFLLAIGLSIAVVHAAPEQEISTHRQKISSSRQDTVVDQDTVDVFPRHTKRAHPNRPFGTHPPFGWTWNIIESSCILPVQPSASALTILYQSVFEQATAHFWGRENQRRRFEFTWGDFRFEMFCTQDIPWQLISTWAFVMLNAAKRGYTARYKWDLINKEDGTTLWVRLLVPSSGDPAPLGLGSSK